MSGVTNPRAVVPTLTDGMLAELSRIYADLDSGSPTIEKRDRRNNRCPHGFIDQGSGLCWECDLAVKAQNKTAITASIHKVGWK